jgi:FdhE protein
VSSTLLAAPTADALAQEHPEWRAWLALLEVTAEEARGRAWEEAVPTTVSDGCPYLGTTTLAVDRTVAEHWVRRLFAASEVTALGDAGPRIDALALIAAAIRLDAASFAAIAAAAGAPPDALGAVAPLAGVPWLQACGRRWPAGADAATSWCPVCGAWATLAEARGLERERRLRCGRCGGDWRTAWLACPFCGNEDHGRLTSLVGERTGDTRKVDACRECTAYVKTVTTLAAADAPTLRLLDLATVDLDVAALERGFTRPGGLGHALDITVVERAPERRFWRR